MTREEVAAVVNQWLDVFSRHDVEALAALYAEDCLVDSPLAAGAVKGRDANARVFRTLFETFPDVRFAPDDTLVDGDRAVQVGVLTGTDTGGLMGMAPSGKPFIIPMVWFFGVRDGCIVHERRIYDFTGLLVQIGVLKAKPA